MAATQSKKKKAQAQKRRKQPQGRKTLCKKTQTKQNRQQLKTRKEKPKKPKKLTAGQVNKVKGNSRATSHAKNISQHESSSEAKGAKWSKNHCTLSARDLQHEVNELMRKDMTMHMFPNERKLFH